MKRTQEVEPIQDGTRSNDKGTKQKPVKVIANASKDRFSGRTAGDTLMAHMGHGTPDLPSGQHIWRHTTEVIPMGAHYTPEGRFGSLEEAMNRVGRKK